MPTTTVTRQQLRRELARNVSEEELAMQLDAAAIPYEHQYLYAPSRKFRADFALLGLRVLLEVQGGIYSKQAHGSITGILADNNRLNQATLAGYRVLRFTPEDVADGSAREIIEQLMKETL